MARARYDAIGEDGKIYWRWSLGRPPSSDMFLAPQLKGPMYRGLQPGNE
jgi:hypothetical protein